MKGHPSWEADFTAAFPKSEKVIVDQCDMLANGSMECNQTRDFSFDVLLKTPLPVNRKPESH